MADSHANFAYGTVLTAPSPASSGTTLTLSSGAGALMPAVPFNATVWPTGVNPLNSNAEIVRVTNVSGDDVTIQRAQEGTSARSILVGDQFAATITAKTLTDAEMTITDGANSIGSGTLRLSNANGVSVGINGQTVTFSHNGLTTAAQSNHSHGNPQLNLTNLSGTTASNSGGFTLSLSAYPEGLTTARASNDAIGLNTALTANGLSVTANSSGLSINVPAWLTTAALSNHSHGNPTLALTNLTGTTASNSAGLTLSLSANPAQTVQPGIQSISAGTTRATTGEVVYSNSNGVSFGLNGQTLTASHNGLTTARASNDGVGLATAQSNVTWTVNSGGISIDGRGYAGTGTSATNASVTLNSNGLQISVAAPGGGANFSAGVSNVGNTGGDTGVTGTRLVFVGSQNITLNQATDANGATISISGGAGAAGNTGFISAGAATASLGTVVWSNSNGVSFGVNGQTVTASHNGLTSQSNQAASAANGSFAFQTISFSNLNGISFGTSAGSAITASHNGLTTARASNDAVGLNTALTAGPLAWTVNSAGISLNAGSAAGTTSGFAGNLISGSMTHNTAGLNLSLNHPAWLTTAMQSNAVTLSNIRVSAGTTSNLLSAVTFANGNGMSFGLDAGTITGSHNGLTSQSNQNVTAGNGGFAFQTLSFSNVNGISFGTSAGSAITASHNALTTARASNDGIGLNTAQSNVTWTVNSAGLSLDARGYAGTGTTFAGANISVSLTQNSAGLNMSASVAAPGGGGLTPVASASNGSFSFTTLAFSNANNVTFGTSAGSIITASVAAPGAAAEQNAVNLLGANTAGNTTATGSTIGWSGLNLTLSGTNASQIVVSAPATSSLSATGIINISTNGSTISIGAGQTLSGLVLAPFGGKGGPLPFAQSSISLGQKSVYFYPVQVEDYLTLDHVRMPVLVTNSSSAVSSGHKGETFQFGIYTRNATNNTVYTQMWSTSYTIAASYSSNVSWAQSMITAIGNSTSYNSVTASSAGLNLSASLHGAREFIMPVSTLLTPGEYWFAVHASTSAAGTAGNVLNISNLAVAYQTYNRPGVSTNATGSGFFKHMGAGTYSVTSGALPGGISATQINQLGTLPILFAATGTV